MSDQAYGSNRSWGIGIDTEHAVFLKHAIGAPGHEMQFLSLRVAVKKEIISIAGITIPEAQEPFQGPKSVEGLFVHNLPQSFF